MDRALAHSTWTRARGWALSQRVFHLIDLQQIQTLLNLLRNREVLRSVPDVGIPGIPLRRSLEWGSPGTKTASDVPSVGGLESTTLTEKEGKMHCIGIYAKNFGPNGCGYGQGLPGRVWPSSPASFLGKNQVQEYLQTLG